jgi:alcohol dehydrogenase, propanol-preferring
MATMKAMVLEEQPGRLVLCELPVPVIGPGEILIRVAACAVCRTDLHIVDGELRKAALPLVPGHEIVGEVVSCGPEVTEVAKGDRVGVPWLGGACGKCEYCRSRRENLCDWPVFTGYLRDGGFAEYAAANARYCFRIPDRYTSVQAAPLLCAGLIGYRSLRVAAFPQKLGLYGFGAAAHIVAQVARHRGAEIYAFTRPGDAAGQSFARQVGAVWSGGSDAAPPVRLDAAIIYAPVGELVPAALAAVRKGGRVVCAGIHMSAIPSFPYELLWGERCVCSVANLTREDGREFFQLAAEIPIEVTTREYRLEDANQALDDLRAGRFAGAAVLVTGVGVGR